VNAPRAPLQPPPAHRRDEALDSQDLGDHPLPSRPDGIRWPGPRSRRVIVTGRRSPTRRDKTLLSRGSCWLTRRPPPPSAPRLLVGGKHRVVAELRWVAFAIARPSRAREEMQSRRAPASHAWIWAIGAARDSAVGAVRRHLGTSIDARADYCFDPGASTKAASTRCAHGESQVRAGRRRETCFRSSAPPGCHGSFVRRQQSERCPRGCCSCACYSGVHG